MTTSLGNDPQYDGGLSITSQMRDILDQPGFISIGMDRYTKLDYKKLSPFALACMFGSYDTVKQAVESGTAPDLKTTQTPFLFGFVSFTVLGAIRLEHLPPTSPMRHLDVLGYLIASGAPPDVPDISGNTALHHACTPPKARVEVAKALLEKDTNVNAQNRFGEVHTGFALQGGNVGLVEVLMEHGANLDIADANGDSPQRTCINFGPEVTAAVQRWERKRKGEAAPPWEEKRCENRQSMKNGLRQCAHWTTHKAACKPFTSETTVTLKPNYGGAMASTTISRADVTRQAFGLATPTTQPLRPGLTKRDAENESMVIKIQVPVDFTNSPINFGSGALFIYNKKRDFVCTVTRESNPGAYDTVVRTVRTQGVGGAKAYFAAELKNPNELVVKVSEVLAAQPF